MSLQSISIHINYKTQFNKNKYLSFILIIRFKKVDKFTAATATSFELNNNFKTLFATISIFLSRIILFCFLKIELIIYEYKMVRDSLLRFDERHLFRCYLYNRNISQDKKKRFNANYFIKVPSHEIKKEKKKKKVLEQPHSMKQDENFIMRTSLYEQMIKWTFLQIWFDWKLCSVYRSHFTSWPIV